MAVLFSQKELDDCFGGPKLIAIYCNTKLYMLDGFLLNYVCNQTC